MEYYSALTGLRSVGAFLVFCHHFYGQWFPDKSFPGFFLQEGYIGVSIFFTLSGFLITRTYMSKLGSGPVRFREYWVRRFARVYPLYCLLLSWKFLVRPDLVKSTGQLVVNFTLSQAFFHSWIWTGIAPAWSLTVEESFYFLAPSVFFIIRSRSVARAFWVLLAFTVAFWVLGDLICWIMARGDFFASLMVHQYNLLGRFGEFALGVFIAFVVEKMSCEKEYCEKLPIGAETAFFGGVILIALSLGILSLLRERTHQEFGILSSYGFAACTPASVGTVLLIIAALKGSAFSKVLLGNRCVEYLGRVSYAFYLLQDRFFANPVTGLWKNEFVPVFLSLTVLSIFVYELAEKPLHRRVIAFMSRAKKTVSPPSSPGTIGILARRPSV
ncbi:MAG: acyltransferase [Oligoflexia bacterium]|nr:acyltransferase [Oligoflexia bacterium]